MQFKASTFQPQPQDPPKDSMRDIADAFKTAEQKY